MPTFAPQSSTVVRTPEVLATLNDYANETLIPQGYTQTAFFGFLFGGDRGASGLGDRPGVSLPKLKRPQRKKGSGTQAEMILNFETNGNAEAFYDLDTLQTGIYLGGTKAVSPFAHYTTYCALSRTMQKENSGPGKQYDILKSQLEQSMRNMFTTLETDLLSTNTDISHGTQDSLAGLRHWNSSSPSSGTQHGIARGTFTTFRNQTTTTSSFASSGLDDMDTVYYSTAGTNGNEKCDSIWLDDTNHGYYSKQAQAVHRLVGDLSGVDLGTAGTLFFKGIPLIWHPSWPSLRADWLRSDYIHPFVLSDWEMETPGKPNNVAIAYEMRKFWAGCVIVSRPEVNAVHTISAA